MLSYNRLDNRQRDDEDGDLWIGELGYRRAVGGTGVVGVSVYAEDKDVPYELEDYSRLGLAVFGQADIGFGVTLRPRVFVEQRRFDRPSPLFTDDPDELGYGASLRVEKTDWFVARAFTPFASLSYRRVNSGIEAFSYDEVDLALGLERRF